AMAGRELTTTPTKRERRKSPAADGSGAQPPPPISPTSSVADTTFEPTIDMMVNDFDDEATLNEEEALAQLESHSAEDEIATLREESEMPIEQLLAKYSSSMPGVSSYKRSSSSTGSGSRRRRKRQREDVPPSPSATEPPEQEQRKPTTTTTPPAEEEHSTPLSSAQCSDAGGDNEEELSRSNNNSTQRSHLLDLYPEQQFAASAAPAADEEEEESLTPLQTLFEQQDEEEEEEEEGDSDTDSDDVRKIIMVGPDYQADIPEGLSQYGDILPYENEDQLVWAPSQVTEREVEDYLAKLQETRAGQEEEEATESQAAQAVEVTASASVATAAAPVAPLQDLDAVVKDNEQALHLLVQCGYDFKEALRRKRMNVLPLSDTMSSWSEEECVKFEEGIQKYGKDFYQIRQQQVRTRTMRELVQFYYLWKKSERRDQCFALNDTIDHMDVFINEGEERAGNGNGNGTTNGSAPSLTNGSDEHGTTAVGGCNGHSNGVEHALEKDKEKDTQRKATAKNYSIMTGSGAAAAAGTGTSNGSGTSGTSRKRGASFALEEQQDESNEQDLNNL
ncbi:hypothetical protein KR222_010105, partial [Zaprionus bogoriensis]